MLSSERAFDDFMTEMVKAPLRVLMERPPVQVPAAVFLAIEYQEDTDRLTHGLRSGTFRGLRLAFEQCTGLSSAERWRVA